ncbi:Uncharacterised protein [Mycobacteroides abscessus subsp. massiliense]|nr:Uncharacterised protein [Mycobacteroides abscessus subsp. massiliense]
MMWHVKFNLLYKNIESYKILLRFLVWMNYQMKINKLWNEHVEFNSSYHKTSTLQNNLLDKKVHMYLLKQQLQTSEIF